MRVVGVDENGLGPLLGPLIVTAVSMDVGRYDASRLAEIGRDAGITDSKVSAAFGRMAHCEGIALAALERTTGVLPESMDDVLAALAIDGELALRAPCPDAENQAQCFSRRFSLPAFGGDVAAGRAALSSLARRKISVVRVRSAVACVRVINEAIDRGGNKLGLNLSLFERLVLDARAASGEDLRAICGMVGGIRNYPAYFTHLPNARARAGEGCAYEVDGVGAVSFEIDSDAHHLPVALASMIGKYVRELSVERHARFYAAHAPELPRASGYHDPVTKRFVAESAALRLRLRIQDDCFARRG